MTTDPKTSAENDAPQITPRADYEMNVVKDDSSKVMMAATIVILVVAIAGGIIAVTPQVKNMARQKEKIADLEAELAKAKQSEQPNAVEAQLSDVQSKMQVLADQAEQFKSAIATGDMQSKLAQLETKFDQVVQQAHSLGLNSLMSRVSALQQTPEGASAVTGLVGMLANAPAGTDIGQTFEAMRQSDPSVAKIAEGVAPEDMKAAAMLIAMSQLRSSLQKDNSSFDADLALLKRTLPSDDPKLAEAIDRLAPKAKYGVLTPSGLSQQFRGMTGDIVSASLSGSDVSLREKAKARLADVFMVEKNGQRISGTEAQIAIAAAQKELDMGNVDAAIEILQTLKGPAAEKTQPFLEQAQATVLAGNLQNMLGQNILQSLKANAGVLVNGMPDGVINPMNVMGITNQIKTMSGDTSPPVVVPVH